MQPGAARDSCALLKVRDSLVKAYFDIEPKHRGWPSQLRLQWSYKAPHEGKFMPTGTASGVDTEHFRKFLAAEVQRIDSKLTEMGVNTSSLTQPIGYRKTQNGDTNGQ